MAACNPMLDALVQQGRLLVTTLPEDGKPPLDEEQLSSITAAFYSRDLHFAPSAKGNESTRAFFKAAQRAPKLRWLQLFFAGINDLPVIDRLMANGVEVTTAAGAGSQAIAQTVVAAVLAISRGFLHHLDAKRRKQWSPLAGDAVPRPLKNQQVTIVGLGPIGREVSRLLRVFGLRTIGVNRTAAAVEYCDEVIRYADLASVLPVTDWLVLACPLTDLTRRLINKAAIGLLPAGARIINVARGEVLDEAALIDALRDGHVSAAYLDVFSQEPLPADSPLWNMDNVLLSAHTASASADNEANVQAIFLQNLERFCAGLPLANSANGPSMTAAHSAVKPIST